MKLRRRQRPRGAEGWTWQLPPAGDGQEGLEGYRVEDAAGRLVGTVAVLLRRDDSLWLVVRAGSPWRHEFRALPWSSVRFVDHAELRVGLAVFERDLAQAALLAPERAVRGRAADAARVTAPPSTVASASDRLAERRRGAFASTLAVTALALLAFFGVIVFATRRWLEWEFGLFAVPTALGLAALAYHRARRAARSLGLPSK